MNKKSFLLLRGFLMLLVSSVALAFNYGVAEKSFLEFYLMYGAFVVIWLYELARRYRLYEKTVEYQRKLRVKLVLETALDATSREALSPE